MTHSFLVWLRHLLKSSPLHESSFRLFYIGSLGTALGYTMQATMASWLMATLTPSALMVALVQTASTVPTLLFGLIAGSLADIVERRKVILVTQWAMLTIVIILGSSTIIGAITPMALLLLTFLFGCSFTFYLPAQQSSINEFVSRDQLPAAAALSALAFNSARATGPALAGAIASWLSSGSALLASALFFTVMVVAVRRWKHLEHRLPGVPERLFTGVRSGVRFARHSSAMRALLIRSVSFYIFASAFWALLPLVARDLLSLGAQGFGLLSAGFGAGAIVGAWSIPQQFKQFSLTKIVFCGSLAWVVAIGLLAVAQTIAVAITGAFVAGVAWVCILASVSAGVQSSAPSWVRARAVSMNLVAGQASLAVGSALWGLVASEAGVRIALAASAAGLLVIYILTFRFRVEIGGEADVILRSHAPDLVIPVEPLPNDGPVLTQIEYRIDREHLRAFLRAIEAVGPTRRRNGATSWRVFRNLEEQDCVVERYVIDSWADYLRHRARMTLADIDVQETARQFQREGVPIRVSRLIGIDTDAVFLDSDESSSN